MFYIVHDTDRRRAFKVKDNRRPYYHTVIEFCYGGRAGKMEAARAQAEEMCRKFNEGEIGHERRL